MPFIAAAAFLGSAAFGTAAGVSGGAILADLAIGSILMGTGFMYESTKQQAKTQEALYKYSAAQHQREAEYTRLASTEMQRSRRKQMRGVLSAQKAQYAKAGVMMTGSPMEVQLQTLETIESDIATRAFEYGTEAGRQRSLAALDIFQAKAAKKAGRLAAYGTLFSGVGQVGSMGMQYQLAQG